MNSADKQAVLHCGVKFDFDEEQEQIDFVQPHRTVGKLINVDLKGDYNNVAKDHKTIQGATAISEV